MTMKDGEKLSTDPYKGVRDFYPEDMAIERYIFDVWSKTAESFGFERYDASVLEPSELYKAKGAQNEEIVNDQTYTFIDKGDREVTLRPEMTPTVARMVSGRRRDLMFPLRWYSIPNVFRYERAQRGRLREHWQLNADIFGTKDTSADVEIILLGYSILKAFGAKDSDFEIRVNNRELLTKTLLPVLRGEEFLPKYLYLLDRKNKMSAEEFKAEEAEYLKPGATVAIEANGDIEKVLTELHALGVKNAVFDSTIVRGFDYYTGTIFEIFDTNPDNRRSLLGGGRYDNLTALFGGDQITGIGFGMGDVTMRDFLETHELLPGNLGQTVDVALILPDLSNAGAAQSVAQKLRAEGVRVAIDLSGKKIGDQIGRADKRGIPFIIVVGEQEITDGLFTLKKLADASEMKATLEDLLSHLK